MENKEAKLAALAEQWRQAKMTEEGAKEERIDIENRIIALTGHKDEGSQTVKAGDHKIVVTGKINRTLDRAAWEQIAGEVPEALRPVEYAPRLDTKGLRYIQNNEPDIYRLVCQAVTAKPGKTAVEVK